MATVLKRGWLNEVQRDVQREVSRWPSEMRSLRAVSGEVRLESAKVDRSKVTRRSQAKADQK